MSAFQVVATCHQLSRLKGSDLFVSGKKQAISIMRYADHSRIVSVLRGFFGNVQVVDGSVEEYTDVGVTGDHTGTVWSLPEYPCLLTIEDIADSILACYKVEVGQRRVAHTVDSPVSHAYANRYMHVDVTTSTAELSAACTIALLQESCCHVLVFAGRSEGRPAVCSSAANCKAGALLAAQRHRHSAKAKKQRRCCFEVARSFRREVAY